MIFHQSILLTVVVCAVAVHAINKKSDENGGQQGNQPVYSGPGANGPYVPNQYNPNSAPEHGGQGNLQQGNPQNNMYYYYYPVQDKQKEAQYQHANPQMNHQASAAHDGGDHGPMEAAASGSEMSYSAQDLGQEYNQQNQAFDPQTLSNLASQLQMQGFNGNQNFDGSNQAMSGFGPQGEASNHMPQVHPNFNGQMGGPQGPMGFVPQGQYGQQFYQQNQPQQSQASELTSSITSGLKKYGLTSILMPVLALAGLSLLLPTVTSLGTTTTKTKRSVDDSSPITSYIEKVDNYYKLYNKAMEKEECMNRMICELGDAVSGVRGRSALLMVVENLAPQWMEKKMAVFKNGALGKETQKCKKYTC